MANKSLYTADIKSLKRFLIVAVVVFMTIMMLNFIYKAEHVSAATTNFYVSTTGNDTTGNGSLATPWATIQKARDYIRTNNLNLSMTGDIIVNVAAGNYYVTSTIQFTDTDSGSNGYRVIYKNKDAVGSAHFIGGQQITSWTLYSGNIYRSNVGTSWQFYTLYENGVRARTARYPNYVYNSSYPTSQGPYLRGEGVNGSNTVLQYKVGDLNPAGWSLSDAQVYVWSGGKWAWFTDTVPISSINTTTRQITLAQQSRYVLYQSSSGSRYYVQGVLSMLDAPGEFYLDRTAGYLYYWAKDGAIGSQTIVAPKVQKLLSIAGASESVRAHHIQFDGLSFEDSDFFNWYRHGQVNAGDSGEGHAYPAYDRQISLAVNRTGMVFLSNTDNITIKNSRLKNSGFHGIYMLFYNQNNTISGNLIENIGHTGIYLEGKYPSEGDVLKNNVFTNNLIRNLGETAGQGNGIAVMSSGSNEFSYSEIYNAPRMATFWGVDSGTQPKSVIYAHDNVFKYLKIHDVMQDSGDAAGMDAFGITVPGDTPYLVNTVQQVQVDNLYTDPSMTDISAHGIYMDSGSPGQVFTNVQVTNTANSSYDYNHFDSGPSVTTNVSWVGGFNESSMDYLNIGYTASFPYLETNFNEGFEKDFGNWTTTKGTKSTSTVQKHSGSKSYVLNQDQDLVYHSFGASMSGIVTMWFYDDAADTSLESFGKVDNGAWNDSNSWRGLGVDTPVSTTKYVYRNGVTEAATTVTRTTGWHEFKWDYTSGTKVDMYIDGTLVTSPTGVTSFKVIALGDWWANSRTGTVYFDDVQLQSAAPIPTPTPTPSPTPTPTPTPFVDGFESGFANWTTNLGTASTSTVQKHGGSNSYILNEDSDVITHSFGASFNKIVKVWFYDDAADTSLETFGKVDNGAWNDSASWRGIGVDTPISTTKYVYRIGVVETATAITRTTGWHEFKWDYTSGTKVDMYIDGTLVASPTGTTAFSGISVGDWWANGRTGTVYYDDVSTN